MSPEKTLSVRFLTLIIVILLSYIIAYSVLSYTLFDQLKPHNIKNILYELSVNPNYSSIGFAIAAFIGSFGLFVNIIKRIPFLIKAENFISTVYGNAKFINLKDLKEAGFIETSGMLLGRININKNRYVKIFDPTLKPTLILGSPDSGKSNLIISSLLQIKYPLLSGIVIEFKDEIYLATSNWLKHCGIRIIRFNLDSSNINDTFNIFEELDINSPTFIDEVADIVQIIVTDEKNTYVKSFLTSVIVARMLENKKTSFRDLAYFFRSLSLENDEKISYISLFSNMQNSENSYVRSAGISYLNMLNHNPKMFDIILMFTAAALDNYLGALGEITAKSTFKIKDISRSPTWLYINIPFHEIKRLIPFTHLLINYIFKEICREKDPILEKKYPIQLIIDDFIKLGYFPHIANNMDIMKNAGVKVTITAQSVKDLERLYGRDNLILSQCGTKVVLGVNDNYTAEKLSLETDMTTEAEVIPNVSYHKNSYGRNHKNVNLTPRLYKKPLVTAEEIKRMNNSEALLFLEGYGVSKIENFRYFEDEELLKRSKLEVLI